MTEIRCHFVVLGLPKPAGSKKAISLPGRAYSQIIDASKNKPWIREVKKAAREAWLSKWMPSKRPIRAVVTFVMPRPANHFKADGTLKDWAPKHHIIRPDGTKLFRCLEDALTGIVWKDDAQVTKQEVDKKYSDRNDRGDIGAYVQIMELPE